VHWIKSIVDYLKHKTSNPYSSIRIMFILDPI